MTAAAALSRELYAMSHLSAVTLALLIGRGDGYPVMTISLDDWLHVIETVNP